MGILVRRSQGNQVLFQANAQSPVFPEIKSLITKTIGIHDVIRSSLALFGGKNSNCICLRLGRASAGTSQQ